MHTRVCEICKDTYRSDEGTEAWCPECHAEKNGDMPDVTWRGSGGIYHQAWLKTCPFTKTRQEIVRKALRGEEDR